MTVQGGGPGAAHDDGDLSFLRGDSRIAQTIRLTDWSGCPIGPPAQWPAALRWAMRTILATRQPACVFWGPDLCFLYNDAFGEAVRPEPPLGTPARLAGPATVLSAREAETRADTHLAMLQESRGCFSTPPARAIWPLA